MFDRAFASIATAFSSQFGGPYVDALATWQGEPVKDVGGSIIAPAEPSSYACSIQFDSATQAMRATEGFLETDIRLLVLTFDRPLDTTAGIMVASGEHAGAWQLLSCQRDPGGVGWDCRGRRI